MLTIIDWILDLFRHEDAARAFVAAPEQTLRDAGFGAVSPAQLAAVAATAVPGMMLGGGDPVVGLQRAVSNHYGFEPSQEWAQTNQWAPSAQWAPSFAPEANTDLASHNQTELASHNDTALLSPEQNSGANSQQGGFNLGFGDFVLGGNKTTASDGAVVVDGHAHGSIVTGDGAVLGNGNDVNNGDVWAGTGSNVSVGHGTVEHSGATNIGAGSVITDNDAPVFSDVDAGGGNGGGASGGSSLIGLGSGGSHGGNAGSGGIVVVSKETSVGGDSDSTAVDSHVSTVTTTTVTDHSDHSVTDASHSVFDNRVFDSSHDTALVNSTLDNSHDLSLASGNSLASDNHLF